MQIVFTNIAENLRISFSSIRSNLLRTILTILIIGIGIMALVGILTAIDAIKNSINSEFTRMGANTFTIQTRGMRVHVGGNRTRTKNMPQITYRQAMKFKEDFNFPAVIALYVRATQMATVKYKSFKSNPNIPVLGSDENYLITSGFDIAKGRNFSLQEIQQSRNLVILGSEIANSIFSKEDPIDKVISIGNSKYKVIGVLKAKGSSFGFSDDKLCIIPFTNVRQYFARPDMTYNISVQPIDNKLLDISISEAEGLFRNIRKLGIKDETDFQINKSDNLAQMLLQNISFVTIAATIIGLITLFGAAVGLMNIMLVAVNERTREIGTRKALGATSKMIKQQFLYESVVICQMGGIVGIILGIAVGNIVSVLIGTSFIIPWIWIIVGLVLCFIVGISSGLLPAIKAAKLDPIIALRYE